jgi:secondary thiamine-phosphate synthase enzyme
MVSQERFQVRTAGRGTVDITGRVQAAIHVAGVRTGLAQVFVQHTSASLLICENADPAVRRDLERFLSRLAPDGDPAYEHDAEGPDDMPAHIRSVLTQTGVSVPVAEGRASLGTWQGIYLYEHRRAPQMRTVAVTVLGD